MPVRIDPSGGTEKVDSFEKLEVPNLLGRGLSSGVCTGSPKLGAEGLLSIVVGSIDPLRARAEGVLSAIMALAKTSGI